MIASQKWGIEPRSLIEIYKHMGKGAWGVRSIDDFSNHHYPYPSQSTIKISHRFCINPIPPSSRPKRESITLFRAPPNWYNLKWQAPTATIFANDGSCLLSIYSKAMSIIVVVRYGNDITIKNKIVFFIILKYCPV